MKFLCVTYVMVIEGGWQVCLAPPPLPLSHAILYFCKNRHNIVIEKLLLSSKFINAIHILNIKPKYEHTHTHRYSVEIYNFTITMQLLHLQETLWHIIMRIWHSPGPNHKN